MKGMPDFGFWVTVDVFAIPGLGASDALLDWLWEARVQATIHDVREVAELADALAHGFTRFPVLRDGHGEVVQGFDPVSLACLFSKGEDVGCGLSVRAGPDHLLVVTQVRSVAAGLREVAADLRTDDVILQVAGCCLLSVEHLRCALASHHPLHLLIRRSGRVLPVAIAARAAT